MMVNEFNKNAMPWQGSIPQQMPWMSSYQPTNSSMHFGQHPVVGSVANPLNISQPGEPQYVPSQQHPSIVGYPTPATVTMPVTVSPTSPAANFSHNNQAGFANNCITTTTQSYMKPTQQSVASTSSLYTASTSCGSSSSYDPTGTLTHIPQPLDQSVGSSVQHHKRSSIELEDDMLVAEEPPTKQLLSEKKLFRQFGSLQIDPSFANTSNLNDDDSSDSDDSSTHPSAPSSKSREEFNRYVYLLFKGKSKDQTSFVPSNHTLARLAREEREKLSKAVVLWSPPIRNRFFDDNDVSDDDETEFRYKDHTDFLKTPPTSTTHHLSNQIVTITELTEDETKTSSCDDNQEADEMMLE